jgi:putative cardiolipin synthase
VGSPNLDPRSSRLNTEMGVVLDSPTLAAWFVSDVDKRLPEIAWRIGVRTDAAGQEGLTWTTMEQGKEVTTDKEPGMSVAAHRHRLSGTPAAGG